MTLAHSLLNRRFDAEMMDEPTLDEAEHRQALSGLSRLNLMAVTGRRIWNAVRPLVDDLGGSRPLRVLDLACGGGDVPIRLWHWARRAKKKIEIVGTDLSPLAMSVAAANARQAKADVHFELLDATEKLPTGFDVVMCSLFLHHLSEQDAQQQLRNMAVAANRLVLVDDLCRTPLAYRLVWLGSHLLSRSPVVHCDGPRSVANAFSLSEAEGLFAAAGLPQAEVRARLPCHWIGACSLR